MCSDSATGVMTEEADPETIRRAREHLSRVAGANIALTKAGPSTILPGQTDTWTTTFHNVGNGPAFNAVLMRAERSGSGTGRRYTITYEASDASGNKTTQQAIVTVSHNNP